MKHFKIFLLACIALITVTSCFEDLDDNIVIATTLDINDFVWKGMNTVYLYKSSITQLGDNNFVDDEAYKDYLGGFDSPEELFESLRYLPIDARFSRIYSNYFDLQNLQQGVSLSNGIEFNLYQIEDSIDVFGVITLVLNNSVADDLGLRRGQIFRAVNGEPLTLSAVNDLGDPIYQNSYTLNFADYDTNGTLDYSDDIITLNGESASLNKVVYTENPVHKTKVLNVGSTTIGYLMYNGFRSSFNNALNDAFAEFSAAGVSELVIDLRYNGGGAIQTAVYLGSMVTGQFTGDVYSKTFHIENLQNLDQNYLFTNSIDDVGAINSLNLSKVYVLTSNRRTASASELVINSLKPYIDVIVIGENTVGKTQASRTVYDSPTIFTSQDVNPSHTYAMQPLIANSVNVNDQLVPSTGLTPTINLTEIPYELGILGDVNEPLLAAAINDITTADRSLRHTNEIFPPVQINSPLSPLEQEMYIDN